MSLIFEKTSYAVNGTEIVRDISARLNSGHILSIIGPNGAGKTHIIKLGLGLLKPSKGRVLLNGTDVRQYAAKDRAQILNYIPQAPGFNWPLPVRDIVKLGLYAQPHLSRAQTHARVEEALDMCNLHAVAGRAASTLSGGEQARVSAARALVSKPKILIADEPFAHLDIYYQTKLMEVFKTAIKAWDMDLLLCIHDIGMAQRLGGEYMAVKAGAVFQTGHIDETRDEAFINSLFNLD